MSREGHTESQKPGRCQPATHRDSRKVRYTQRKKVRKPQAQHTEKQIKIRAKSKAKNS